MEARYLVRSLEGKLRIGLAGQTVLVALAQASVLLHRGKHARNGDEFSKAAEMVKETFVQLPSYDAIIPVLIEHGAEHLPEYCKLTPGICVRLFRIFTFIGIPVQPMLAHPTKALTEVLDRFEGVRFTCEYKYDGERAQV